jgi:hypothetical protein
MRSSLALAAVLALLVVVPATASTADAVIGSPPAPTPIDAYAGRVVWSESSPEGYRLFAYRQGEARQLPIAPQQSPFDVDLGPDREGKMVAVYSRCARLPSPSSQDGTRGCGLYMHDFERARR